MKRIFLAVLMVFALLAVSGCGSGDNSPPPSFVSNILSSPALDGDIELSSLGVFTTTQGNLPFVVAGVDSTGAESRAFLQFSLATIPAGAFISSATLDIVIDNIQPQIGTIPFLIDLVSFQPPTLIDSDFDLPALATKSFPIFQSDIRNHVLIDVTLLMREAQRRNLASFQIRILEDFGVPPGLIEINDTTVNLAPLLRVIFN